MALRALKGDNSPEVLAWQAKNRESSQLLKSKSMELVESFDYRQGNLPGHPITPEEHQYRTRMAVEALANGAIKMADILYDATGGSKNNFQIQDSILAKYGLKPMYSNMERPSLEIKEALKTKGIDLNQAPPRNAVERGIVEGLEFVGGSVGAGGLSKTAGAAKKGGQLVRKFIATHDFKSPVVFQFTPGVVQLNMGLPLNQIKFQKPILQKKSKQIGDASAGVGAGSKPSGADSLNPKLPVRERIVLGGPKQPPTPGRIYSPQDQQMKHHPEFGFGSPNPIRDPKIAQELLNIGYSVPYKDQVYTLYKGKLIKFQNSRPDSSPSIWHAYEVELRTRKSILIQVPEEVIRKMQVDGLISKAKANKWIQNKEKK